MISHDWFCFRPSFCDDKTSLFKNRRHTCPSKSSRYRVTIRFNRVSFNYFYLVSLAITDHTFQQSSDKLFLRCDLEIKKQVIDQTGSSSILFQTREFSRLKNFSLGATAHQRFIRINRHYEPLFLAVRP